MKIKEGSIFYLKSIKRLCNIKLIVENGETVVNMQNFSNSRKYDGIIFSIMNNGKIGDIFSGKYVSKKSSILIK